MKVKAKKFVLEEEYQLPRDTVWRILSDTDSLNQFIGLFPVKFTPVKKRNKEVFFREAFAKVAGIVPLTWEESPFQWVENESYSVERSYLTGPLKHFTGGVELIENDYGNGTKIRLFGEFTPRNILGLGAIPITGLQSMRNTMKYMDVYIKRNKKIPYLPQKATKKKVVLAELTRLETTLKLMPVNEELVALLHQHIVSRSDKEVINMRPRMIAKKWNRDTLAVLRLFLYATKVGILSLSWNLICPNCRVSKAEHASLSNIASAFHCDLCGVSYDANFENYVELKFSVHPSIRKAYDESYCVGGPMITPHIIVQKIVNPDETAQIPLPSSQEKLQIRVLQANHKVGIRKSQIDQEAQLIYKSDGWNKSFISTHTAIPVKNESPNSIVLVVERTDWDEDATTAAEVTAMQEFRDLFSSEVLARGQQVGIENVTILFSDIEGSTSLYEEIGDANAYGQVRRHFDYLSDWISNYNGSVVKTIGDAVMAVFHSSEDGVNAALNIQKHLDAFNDEKKDNIVLKIGVHSGPAIVVNSNDRLDYFGRTVNIAARIQNKSNGGDIVVHKNYLKSDTIRLLLEQKSINLESYSCMLKGVEAEVDLVRIRYNCKNRQQV